jgi:hypothetical protein
VHAVEAETVIDRAADVVDAFRLSVAFAVMEYEPAGTALQTTLKGLVASSPFVAPWKNSTLVTVPGDVSVALALIVILVPAANVAPEAGAVRLTDGGVLEDDTVIDLAADVVLALWLSVAIAVMEYDPAGTAFHTTLYGLVMSSPIFVEPWKNSTFATVPGDVSDALALIVIFEPATKVAPAAGAVRLTEGAGLTVPHWPTVKE